MKDFPIICEVSLILTDGERFVAFSGPVVNGSVPSKDWLLGVIAHGLTVAENEGMTGMRLPTPQELTQHVAQQMGLGRIGVHGGETAWQGFTQAELDVAIAKARQEAEGG